jgi:hypothetical protein
MCKRMRGSLDGSDRQCRPGGFAQRDGANEDGPYLRALDAWHAKCKENLYTAASYVDFAYRDLTEHGVGEPSRLDVMRRLTSSVPDSVGPTDCQSVTAAYLSSREP